MKSLAKSENPSNKPPQEACSGFQVAAYDTKKLFRKQLVILKIVPKASYDVYQCWGSGTGSGSACFWTSGSGSISQRYGSGSFPFLINVLSGLM
jgi:hypothetical protein